MRWREIKLYLVVALRIWGASSDTIELIVSCDYSICANVGNFTFFGCVFNTCTIDGVSSPMNFPDVFFFASSFNVKPRKWQIDQLLRSTTNTASSWNDFFSPIFLSCLCAAADFSIWLNKQTKRTKWNVRWTHGSVLNSEPTQFHQVWILFSTT